MEKTNLPRPLDENLPEVVPDSSPEVIPKNATAFYENHLGDRYPKYPVIADDTPKYVGGYEASATADPVSPYPDSPAPSHGYEQAQAAGYPLPPAEKKILGLKKRTFWIVAITVLIILAAALGGGLGGGLSARNSKASASSEPSEEDDQPTRLEATSPRNQLLRF